jgi:hypothetical protein
MIICNNTAASNRFFIIHVCVDIQNAITAFKTKLFKKLKQKMVENNQQMTQKKKQTKQIKYCLVLTCASSFGGFSSSDSLSPP